MNPKQPNPPSESRENLAPKRPYSKPKLTVHGDLRTITAAKHRTRSDGTGRPRTGNLTQT